MTEGEWLHGDDLAAKVYYLGEGYSFRKARLFAVACGRSVRALAADPTVRGLLTFLERVADDPRQVGRDELYESLSLASRLLTPGLPHPEEFPAQAVDWAFRALPDRMMLAAATLCAQAESRIAREASRDVPVDSFDPARQVLFDQTALGHYRAFLLDIAGNPFRSVAWDPAWRTADALGLARGIYDERAIDRLPLLADALMDAGCDNEAVIGHCRSNGPHVRGCWVVDRVLGKE
jgi:hypothetical protein